MSDAATRLRGSAYSGDDGSADPRLADALAAYEESDRPERYADVLAVLQDTRVLVPVVAVLGEVEHDEAGLARDKSSDMATVLLTGADGRLALLAFTCTDALAAWNAEARPVPAATRVAAQSALQDGAAALLVDVAGPVTFVVEGEDLRGLAAGWSLGRVAGGHAWIGPPGESSDTILR